MNDAPDTAILAQPFAMRLAAGVIAAFLLVVALALMDGGRRAQFEQAEDRGPVARSR